MTRDQDWRQRRDTSSSSLCRRGSSPLRLRSVSRLSTVTSASGASLASLNSQERVRVSDESLLARARAAVASLDFPVLTDLSAAKWTWKQDLNELSLFEGTSTSVLEAPCGRRPRLRNRRLKKKKHPMTEVLVAGDINCSLDEVAAVLRSESEGGFNAAMTRLHDRDFIYGSVVRLLPLPWRKDCGVSARETTGAIIEMSASTASTPTSPPEQPRAEEATDSSRHNYVAVKTATFVRPRLFGRNEEWCFLESFERSPSGDSLVVIQSSLPAFELGSGTAPAHARVARLRGVSTTFLVERVPRTTSVRLVFHAKFDRAGGGSGKRGDGDADDSDDGEDAVDRTGTYAPSSKAVAARLLKLAKSASRIPELARRRRIGAQTLASKATLARAANSRCSCCTRNVWLRQFVAKKQRCHLCAYNVCDRCCSQQTMETRSGHTATVVMCRRCVECVDACEFAGLSVDSHHSLRVEADDKSGSARAARKGTSAALAEILEKALKTKAEPSSRSHKLAKTAQAAVQRARDQQSCVSTQADSDSEDSESASVFASSAASVASTATGPTLQSQSHSVVSTRLASRPPKFELLASLQTELERLIADPISLEDCVLANAEARSYPIHVPANPLTTVPDYPVPANEAWRLRVIDANSLLALGEVAELNVICALAAETLQCAISMVTVIDQETEHILSCNNPDLHRTRMARNQTFCSHLIMDSKPLLLRHPEADVRFHAMDAVAKSGIRFYCGFPLRAGDGTVVGSVCCLDFQQRALTQSQYSLMEKLAQTASTVIQTKGAAISKINSA